VRVLIVDDEAPARRRLARMLAEIPDVEVAGEAGSAKAALRAVEALDPDLMLLDIRMPGMDGIQLALGQHALPDIIFVTAYDAYAVQAFEANAIDYLLKPVRHKRLAEAIERAHARQGKSPASARIGELLSRLTEPPAKSWRVAARAGKTTRLFDAREISRFFATDKLTAFWADGHEQLTEDSLSALETRLADIGFVRVHRSELVNAHHVRALHSDDGLHEVELSDGQRARVSRRMVGALRAALGLAD